MRLSMVPGTKVIIETSMDQGHKINENRRRVNEFGEVGRIPSMDEEKKVAKNKLHLRSEDQI